MSLLRKRLLINGIVQGVGFRPFVFQTAKKHSLTGWVLNTGAGVEIEVQGSELELNAFSKELAKNKPQASSIDSFESMDVPTLEEESAFEIRASQKKDDSFSGVLPDLAVCEDCLAEMNDPKNRRYHYPFINCTDCGPRLSIIQALPYDRPQTTMRGFEMCEACCREYQDPANRRFHAQPIACPSCGPHIELCDSSGKQLAEKEEALTQAVEALREGTIIALKGIGGFQLLVNALDAKAVRELRKRKQRPRKPFALMYPSLQRLREDCELSVLEESLLVSPEAPIVLVQAKVRLDAVAPENPCFGVMLPYSPLHHLLMQSFEGPVVATSGNLAEEPICKDNQEAFCDLARIADLFLIHNRPIQRAVDDSIVRVIDKKPVVLRRARGYAARAISLPRTLDEPCMSFGAHMKNTIAVAQKNQAVLSQHLGDLETKKTKQAFLDAIHDYSDFFEMEGAALCCDLHPNYVSTMEAKRLCESAAPVQHHEAHFFSCVIENKAQPPCLGVVWDGTGYGSDGNIWGGEFFYWDQDRKLRRVGSFRPFPLFGGENAVRDPLRIGFSLLKESFESIPPIRPPIDLEFPKQWERLWSSELRASMPQCSSVGRLFDGVSALLGLCREVSFEAEAAMQLEFAASSMWIKECYPIGHSIDSDFIELDWRPMIRGIVDDLKKGLSSGEVAAKFQNSLARSIPLVLRELSGSLDTPRVLFSGGCFQNKALAETCFEEARQLGLKVYSHSLIPPNDGGIALGQLFR